jgi:glycosyltransferase involved in cell wall biosynthesis
MKVLIVTMGLDIGGAETHVYNLAIGLKKNGIEPIVMSTGGVYVESLNKESIQHITAPLDKKDFKSLMYSKKKVKEVLNSESIHILHAHGRIPSLVCHLASRNMARQFLVTAHAKFKYNLLYRYTSFWGYRTICISEDIKNYLVQVFKVKENRISIIENGIDTDLFYKGQDKIEIPKKRIVLVSRLDEKLGTMCRKLIDAVALLDEEGKAIELNIIGDGNYFNTLQTCIKKKKLTHSEIHLLGKRTDVYRLLPNHDLAVCVSRSAMEAMACELPLIIAGGEGYMGILSEDNIEEAMNNNLTGRGYNEDVQVSQLKEDVETILFKYNEEQRNKMGVFNRNIVLSNYSLDGMIQKTIKVYKKLLGVE